MKRVAVCKILWITGLILFLSSLALPLAAAESDAGFILILHAYHAGYAWTDSLELSIRSTLQQGSDLEIVSEYMDTKREPYQEIRPLYRNYLRGKYTERNHSPALILCTDDDALDFLIEFRDELFPGVPVVFCGINNWTPERTSGFANSTGVNEAPDFEGTLRLAVDLIPDRTVIIGITDTTTTGQANMIRFRQAVNRVAPRQPVLILDDWDEQELHNLLADHPRAVVVLVHSNLKTRDGTVFSTAGTLDLIRRHTDAPIFSCWDYLLGLGMLGGSVVSGQNQGQAAAERGLRILAGEPAETIPVLDKSPNRYAFHTAELTLRKIPTERLPPGSLIIGQPLTFFESFRNAIWIASGAFLVLLSIVIFLVLYTLLRRKSRRELEESRVRLDMALQGGELGLWDWDLETGHCYFSDEYLAMLGLAREEIAPSFESWKNLLHPEDREKALFNLGQHITGGTQSYEAEYRLRTKKGSWKWIFARGRVMEQDPKTGKALRVSGTHMDITTRKQQELELTEKNQLLMGQNTQIRELNERLVVVSRQAQEADHLKSAFLSNVSHEVRTPLNGIIGFSELLEDPAIPDKEKKEYVSIIRSSGEHLLSLINDIILISKSDAGQIEIRPRDFNAVDIVRDLSDFFQANTQIREKKLKLLTDFPEEPLMLHSDPDRIRQIISNLVINAIRHTDKGSIRIGLKLARGEYIFSVEDTGRGIPEEYREKIFERFYQITDSAGSQIEGTGLGLSICKALAEHLGGSIQLDSEPGRGSLFQLIIPRHS